jgi:hypothetical protein
MLLRHPIQSTVLPRLHVSSRRPDGAREVFDRATGLRFEVYAPKVVDQFRAGHRAGCWYLRPVTVCDNGPRSPGFASARAAVSAIRDGHWGAMDRIRNRSFGGIPRVTW